MVTNTIKKLVAAGDTEGVRAELQTILDSAKITSSDRGEAIIVTLRAYLEAKNKIMADHLSDLEDAVNGLEELGLLERKADDNAKIAALKKSLRK